MFTLSRGLLEYFAHFLKILAFMLFYVYFGFIYSFTFYF